MDPIILQFIWSSGWQPEKKISTMPKSPRLWHLGPPSLLQLRSSARSKTFARLLVARANLVQRKDTSRSGVGPTDHIDALAGSRNHVRDQRFRFLGADTDVCRTVCSFLETNLRVIACFASKTFFRRPI